MFSKQPRGLYAVTAAKRCRDQVQDEFRLPLGEHRISELLNLHAMLLGPFFSGELMRTDACGAHFRRRHNAVLVRIETIEVE